MSTIASFDIDGSARGAVHTIPVGTPVWVKKGGVRQPWADAVVFRHDRNGTYRIHFTGTDTYVTAHSGEVKPKDEVFRRGALVSYTDRQGVRYVRKIRRVEIIPTFGGARAGVRWYRLDGLDILVTGDDLERAS